MSPPRSVQPVAIDLGPEVSAHLAVAIAAHVRWLRLDGRPVPQSLTELAAWCTDRARQGQRGPDFVDLADARERAVVSPRLLSYEQVAAALNCSERHVKRLTAAGALPTVKLGGLVRVRLDDLDDYVTALTTNTTGASA